MIKAERQETIFEKKQSLLELNKQLLNYGHLTWKQYFKNENRIIRAYDSMMDTIRIAKEIKFERELRFANHGYHIG